MDISEPYIRGKVRRIIAELSSHPSSNAASARTGLSSLGFTKERQEELRRTLETSFTVLAGWSSLDLDDASVADIEQLVLSSVSAETTVLHQRNAGPGRLKAADPRAHMRGDDRG
jgi:hypothetical protein